MRISGPFDHTEKNAEHEVPCEVCTGTFFPRAFVQGWNGASWCKCPGAWVGAWHTVCAGCTEDFGLLGEALPGNIDWTWGTGAPLLVCPESDEVRVARELMAPERKVAEAISRDNALDTVLSVQEQQVKALQRRVQKLVAQR